MISIKLAKSIAYIMAYFDFEKVIRIEKFLEGQDNILLEDITEEIDELKDKVLNDLIDFSIRCENDKTISWMETYSNLRFEYNKDIGIILRYQPIVIGEN